VAEAPAAAPAPAASAPAPAAPAVRHPIETQPSVAAAPAPQPERTDAGLRPALDDLLGARAVLQFVQVDMLIGRIVATVDNLDREHAAARLWPVNPTPGRFAVLRIGDADRIAAGNAERYRPFVAFVEGIDTPRAVALYVRLYPQFQQAYAALGYPRGYFNDRLIDVIDHLLATTLPASASPDSAPAVKLVEVKGPVASTQPWTRYEFAEPGLESTSAGRKLLLRIGSDNAQRLKAKLAEFRRALVAGTAAR
jgi:hypothetical protein